MRDYGRGNQQKSGLSPQAEAYTHPKHRQIDRQQARNIQPGRAGNRSWETFVAPS